LGVGILRTSTTPYVVVVLTVCGVVVAGGWGLVAGLSDLGGLDFGMVLSFFPVSGYGGAL
jgi:hypothetical protein